MNYIVTLDKAQEKYKCYIISRKMCQVWAVLFSVVIVACSLAMYWGQSEIINYSCLALMLTCLLILLCTLFVYIYLSFQLSVRYMQLLNMPGMHIVRMSVKEEYKRDVPSYYALAYVCDNKQQETCITLGKLQIEYSHTIECDTIDIMRNKLCVSMK